MSLTFTVDIRLAVLRSLQSALAAAAALDVYRTLPGADTLAGAAGGAPRNAANAAPATEARHRPRPRAPRAPLTAAELAVVRAPVTVLIRRQPDQRTMELARTVGIPSVKLTPPTVPARLDGGSGT